MSDSNLNFWCSELESLGLKVRLNEFNDSKEIGNLCQIIKLKLKKYKRIYSEQTRLSSDRFSFEEWEQKSQRGEVCGVGGCYQKPTSQCATCLRYYCYQDIQNHVHRV
jgi:hypothetical protein